MRAKCRHCQANLNTQEAYKTTLNNKNAYFCNKEHYNKFLQAEDDKKKKQEQEAHARQKFYDLFCEILGVGGITNTALWKEKCEINKVFSDNVIISYLEENKEWIASAVSKLSGGEYGKIRYVSVILRNGLGDYKPKTNIKPTFAPKIQEEHYETKFKSKIRAALLDLEEDCDE